jgi:hypothetical protein
VALAYFLLRHDCIIDACGALHHELNNCPVDIVDKYFNAVWKETFDFLACNRYAFEPLRCLPILLNHLNDQNPTINVACLPNCDSCPNAAVSFYCPTTFNFVTLLIRGREGRERRRFKYVISPIVHGKIAFNSIAGHCSYGFDITTMKLWSFVKCHRQRFNINFWIPRVHQL